MMGPETVYGYTMRHGEKYALFGDVAIVVHPDREPIVVAQDGTMSALTLFRPLRSTAIDKPSKLMA
jgi:hypothetical protein